MGLKESILIYKASEIGMLTMGLFEIILIGHQLVD